MNWTDIRFIRAIRKGTKEEKKGIEGLREKLTADGRVLVSQNHFALSA